MAGLPEPGRLDNQRRLAARADRLLPYAAELAIAGGAIGLFAALFMPWYDPHFYYERLQQPEPPGVEAPSGWEAFRTVDILLTANAMIALGSIGAARLLGYRAVYALAGLLSWFAVVWILYGFFRPSGAWAGGAPASGYFFALCAAGAITGGCTLALIERRPRTTAT